MLPRALTCRAMCTDLHVSDEAPETIDAGASAAPPEPLYILPEPNSMDIALEAVITLRFRFFHDNKISENARVAQLFADAINVSPGLQHHVRKRLVRFSSLKFQESPKARRKLRRDLDQLLENNVACSQNLLSLGARFWDRPGLQTASPEENNEWDPTADRIARPTMFWLASIWDSELKALYRVVRTFFHDRWLPPTAGNSAPSHQYSVDLSDENEQRLIMATVQCHKEITASLGRRKQNSFYQLLTRLYNRHVSAIRACEKAREQKPKKQKKTKKQKGRRAAAPKLVTASTVISEVAVPLQKHPRAHSLVTRLFEGRSLPNTLDELTYNAVLLKNVKQHFHEIDLDEPEPELPVSTETTEAPEQRRVTFVSADVVQELREESEAYPSAHATDDGGSEHMLEPVVWHMRSQRRGFAEAECRREDDWESPLPASGGAVVFANMQVPPPSAPRDPM